MKETSTIKIWVADLKTLWSDFTIKQKCKHIIWDWNGTLFDDVNWCIKVINKMLAKRGMEKLKNISEYHAVFCFPVIDYYRNVGFDFTVEPFEALAEEFMELYRSDKSGYCKLFPDALTVLETIKNANISQVLLSASNLSVLLSQMSEFDISGFFDEMLGLTDIYAKSKIDIGLDYIKRNKTTDAVLIGDTKHDFEVAQALGVDCILISNGHQSREQLLSCGVPILNEISDVVNVIHANS